ncbi:MAG: glycosyltransferase family 39 protein [Xenococcus sp. (in: cyanobacteria)]
MFSLKRLYNSYFKVIVILVLVLGIIFRLGNLDVKPYWEDEIYTSMRISGYQSDQLKKVVLGRPMQVQTLSQYLDVKSGKSWLDTATALVNKPEHSPLYFLLAKAWAEIFGSSTWSMRAFPALVSLITLPLFYWLSLLLFKSPNIASITVCLVSVSPIMIRYAQEARPYSLWIVCILLSSIALLRAWRLETKGSWIFYSATVSLAFLTHLLSFFVFLVHSLYVLILLRFDKSIAKDKFSEKTSALLSFKNLLNAQKSKIYFQYLGIGLLPFLPWFILLISRLNSVQKAVHWLNRDQLLTELIFKWSENIVRIISSPFPSPDNQLFLFTIILCLIIAWSVFPMISKSDLQGWLLPTLFCLVPLGIFMTSDLLWGGQKSTISRYLLPSYIGVLLILGFGLGSHYIKSPQYSKNYVFLKNVIFHAVLIVAISACWFNLKSSTWWGIESSSELSAAHVIIDNSNQAIVVSDQRFGDFMFLAYLLRPTDHILWLKQNQNFETGYIFDDSKSTFFWKPSENLLGKAQDLAKKKNLLIDSVSGNDVFQAKLNK